jgi:hypothetical protein
MSAQSATTSNNSSADEERRKRERPFLDTAAAGRLAHDLFGVVVASVHVLDSYDDRNFKIVGVLPAAATAAATTTAAAASDATMTFTLKVHNGVESDDANVIEAQNDVLRHLHSLGVGVCHPVTIAAEEVSAPALARATLPCENAAATPACASTHTRTFVVRLLHW